MHLVPPMDDEPPPAYVAFVAVHLDRLRRETTRLVGGDPEGMHLYMEVLTDVAGHWRRLAWLCRLGRPRAAEDYLQRRLASRTKQWRDDQIYEVDVRVLGHPSLVTDGGPAASLALRKAAVLPGTARAGVVPVADAGIAWVHAYRRQQWHRLGRLFVTAILVVGALIQYLTWLSGS
jgi:hypothetical protein